MPNSSTKKENIKARYNLAKASTRIFARVIDIVIAALIDICIASLVFLTDPNFHGDFNAFIISEPWRYFAFTICSFIWMLIYFIVIPFKFKGQTLGMKLFKIATFNILLFHWFLNLIKKELFIWGLISIINIFLSLTLMIVGYTVSADEAYNLIMQLFKFDQTKSFHQVAALFMTLYSICGLILLIITLSVALNSQHQSLHDKFSNTVVAKLIDVNSDKEQSRLNKKKTKPVRNYKLPGGILDSINDEIDSI